MRSRLPGNIVHPIIAALCGLVLVSGCKDPGASGTDGGVTDAGGDDGGEDDGGVVLYTIGGTVSGLVGTLVLQNLGADDLSLGSDGSFVFAIEIQDGAAYEVTLLSDPLLQNCQVSAGQGTVAGADVDTVAVVCEDKRWYHPAGLDENVSPDTTGAQDARVVMNAGGDALLTWVQSDGSRRQLFLSERLAGSWSHPGALTDFVSPAAGLGVDNSGPPSPALNDAGDAVLTWAQDDGSTDCVGASCWQIYRSVREGGVWTHPADLTAPASIGGQHAHDPRALIDSTGDISLVWSATDGTSCGSFGCVSVYLSERRGGSWTDPSDPLLSAISPPDGRARDPRIGTDDDGNRIVLWRESEADANCAGGNPCFQLFLSTYRSGSWSHPADLSEGIAPVGQHVNRAELAVSSGGNAQAIWQQSDGSQNQVYASAYTSTGWDHPADLSDSLGPAGEAGTSPVVSIDGAGVGVVIWRQSDGSNTALYAIQGSGRTWSVPERLSPPGSDADEVTLIQDDHGNVIVAWAQEDESSDCGGGGCSQIFLSEYRRGTWSHPASLSDHVSPSGQDAESPDLATDDDGNALLTWVQEDGLPGCSEGACAQTFLSEFR